MVSKRLIIVGSIILGLVIIALPLWFGQVWNFMWSCVATSRGAPISELTGPVSEVWVDTFGDQYQYCRALSLSVNNENVFVVGNNEEGLIVRKTSTSGKEVWTRRYKASAHAMTLDMQGNTYIAGTTRDEKGTGIIVNYDIDGNLIGVISEVSSVSSIGLDIDNNIYVTGSSGTEKYSQQGALVWSNDISGFKLLVDVDNNVYVLQEQFIYQLDANGQINWEAPYGKGANQKVKTADMVVDSDGAVYVTGRISNSLHTEKSDSFGNLVWEATYYSSQPVYNNANAITIDTVGNTYIAGESGGDYITIKYNSDGDEIWTAFYDGPRETEHRYDEQRDTKSYSYKEDVVLDVVADESGNAYITGNSEDDCATIKYSVTGSTEWIARYSGGITQHQFNPANTSRFIDIDTNGAVYIAGDITAKSVWNVSSYNFYRDYIVIKYRNED